MKSHRQTTKICFQIIFLSLLALSSMQATEPVYDGKALSEWMDEPDKEVRYNAIRQIGTNAIPTLLDILSVKRGNVKKVVSKLQDKEIHEFVSKEADLEGLRGLAVDGFEALGTNAEPAIPRMTKLLNDDEIRFQAARALTKVGPKGFTVLTNAIAKNEEMRNNIIWVIAEEGGTSREIVTQILINSLKDSNWTVRGNAADFLAGKDPALAVPALISMLDDPAHYPKERAAIALGSFGAAAKSAAPKLLTLYTNDPDVHTNHLDIIVLDALRKIDRDTAGQAEAFLVNSGPLNAARFSYTKTRLPNGRELIAGGYIHTEIPTITNRTLSNAELYDPVTGKWTETGEMNTARHDHQAILLHDGRVLVMGGYDSKWHALASAELYDSEAGKWTETGSLAFARFYHTATLQRDGKVLVEGGHDGRNPLSSKELYDSATGTWTVVTNK